MGPGTYRVCVVGDGYVSKETRIVDPKDGKFSNPVYEFFETKGLPELSNVVIKAGPAVKHPEALKKWKMEEPASPEVDYYLTFELLAEGKLDEFRNRGEYFLFRKKTQDVSVLMMRYYLGCSWLNKNPNKAAGYFLSGLEARPLMSEFWCGLGDCLRLTGQGNKAIRLYKNALIVGARRPAGDEPPVILDYYGDYPRRRIEGR